MNTVANAAQATPARGIELFPVAAREARIAARKIFSYDIRSIVAAVFVAVAFRRMYAPAAETAGDALFRTLGLMAFVYAAIAGAFKTLDALSREKREGTLGLLLLTDLKPFQILFGKLLSASAITVFSLLAFLPILSMPLILGGVVPAQYLRICLALTTTLILSMTWGLYVSASARSYVAALTGAASLVILFSFVPLRIAAGLNASVATFPIETLICLFSPALPVQLAFTTKADLVQFFWPSLFCNLILAVAFIIRAVHLLPIRCHEAPDKSQFAESLKRLAHNLRFGRFNHRARIRRHLTSDNPLLWLAHRERFGSVGLIAICIVALIAGQLLHVAQLGLFVASLAILFRMAHASSHAISEDQKNGALELILSTNLNVEEIVDGLHRAMLRRFMAPVALVIIWPWIFITPYSDPLFRKLLIYSSVLLVLTWKTMSWVGLWFALRRKPTAAAWTTLAVVVLPPWLIWLVSIYPGLFNANYADIQWLGAIVCCVVGVLHCVLLIRWAREILFENFREAAADPFATLAFEPALRSFITPSYLKVVPIGGGNVEVQNFQTTYRLVARPYPGHTFAGWSGHRFGCENPLHLDLQGPTRIIARFIKKETAADEPAAAM